MPSTLPLTGPTSEPDENNPARQLRLGFDTAGRVLEIIVLRFSQSHTTLAAAEEDVAGCPVRPVPQRELSSTTVGRRSLACACVRPPDLCRPDDC